jgi:hypothetical protein
LGILLAAWARTGAAIADPPSNADFTAGGDRPEGWRLEGGRGRWVDRHILEVTGQGQDSNYWRASDNRFAPAALYHFQMRVRRVGGSGSAIAGPTFANRDYADLSGEWKWLGHVFRSPDRTEGSFLRLGQWQATGSIQFDAVRLTPTLPVYRSVAGMLLGDGEMIRDGQYRFLGAFGGPSSNFHRPLVSATTAFNSDRWCFGGDTQITYRLGLPGHQLLSGEVRFEVNYHQGGACLAEVSRDQDQWRPISTQAGLGSGQGVVPAELLPADAIYLRLRPATAQSYFQVNRVEFQGKLSGSPAEANGKTAFADVQSSGSDLTVQDIVLDEGGPSGETSLRVTVKNTTAQAIVAGLAAKVEANDGRVSEIRPPAATVAAQATTVLGLPLPLTSGRLQMAVELTGGKAPTTLNLTMTVPEFYRADYGELLPGPAGKAAVWWCDATHKIPRKRAAPSQAGSAVCLSAAKNDREAAQVVIRPLEPLKGLTASASALAGPNGATIPAESVKILQVYYHFVEHPTDSTGVRDFWPDALPPLDKLDVPAGENQPLWILVRVPQEAKAGDYAGSIALKAEGWSATVPVKLHVWDFALPERNHIDTAFGLSPGEIFSYHQLKTDEDRRKVLDWYFENFAEHRISPYNPTPLDPIQVKFLPKADPPRAELDFSRFDPAMARAVENYKFTNFRLPLEGMGGGTFHERWEPRIAGFAEATPQYQAMYSSYMEQLEGHLREKGWLDMAYIYWFDEPDPKDYEFVRKGMERIKRHAPGLKNMLTEEPVEALAGPIDIWCPVSPNYNHQEAEKRRACGEKFWWYVCCGPKAPFCTLFIDHPATELRVWLWQTWQRKIGGILVWASNYWTSDAAYPDKPQNPYEDPMGYVSGYSTPRGAKSFWGNGDGRFVYPPLAAAAPGIAGPGPVVQPPVASIRWEMLREGIEDYEFLYLLRERLNQKRSTLSAERAARIAELLEVPASITREMTVFTGDPAPIYARRAAVAEAIEALSK